MSLVLAQGLTKTYRAGDVEVPAIKGADFAIAPASFVAFVGPSGSGKSTLLNMIGCLDHPTGGRLSVLGTDITRLDRRAAADFRGRNIGFIFQDFNLVPVLTAYENIEYPLIMVQGTSGKWPAAQRREQVMRLLKAVGMESQADKRGISVSFPKFSQPCFVKADRTRLKQVLINLLSNAIKYNTERGSVVLKCIESNPAHVRISVEDTGAGQGLVVDEAPEVRSYLDAAHAHAFGHDGRVLQLMICC